ncbi:MAG TPA: hypothetical protein VMM79_16265 [Longimicrobiales bacterium]|nr:hypothetical protein [Longimicrobiales bacterium]
METRAQAPASVLPFNLNPAILFERYPELYEHQQSVEKDEATEKNLHVSLCELRHGIPFDRHCNESLFADLIEQFVRQQLASPFEFGYRNHRELVNREMRAILFRHREDPGIAAVSGLGCTVDRPRTSVRGVAHLCVICVVGGCSGHRSHRMRGHAVTLDESGDCVRPRTARDHASGRNLRRVTP